MRARARSGRAPRGRRRRPTTGRARARARAGCAADLGRRALAGPRGRVPRQSRTSAAPRRAPSPRPAELGRREASEVGGGRGGVEPAERARRRADHASARSRRASRAVISCPATARRSAWATVAVRSGRRPRSSRIGPPEQRIGGEAAQELRVVVVEPEHEAHPRRALPRSAPGRRRCRRGAARRAPARARPAHASVVGTTPSRTVRVASLPCRAERRSE